jgi:hypothetical protein
LSFTGDGPNPIAIFRTSWQDDATYLAVKAGSPSNNHGHMDVGEFVIDADGLRWAADLGSQSYESLESKKVDLWNESQNSQRWQVFRIGPMSHNILTVDGQNQVVSGHATIVRRGNDFAVMDLAPVYAGQLASVKRGAVLRPDRSVRIEDELTNADKAATVRFAVMTSAKGEIRGRDVLLSQKKKQMLLRVLSPADAKLQVTPADPPPHDYDATNPGMNVVSISVPLAGGEKTSIVVDFIPDADATTQPAADVVPLDRW